MISDHFPFPEFRPLQAETLGMIQTEFEKGTRFLFLEGPPGCGKSALAIATARWATLRDNGEAPGKAVFLTPQKILQDQYIRSHPGELADLRGRSNYECNRPEVKEFGKQLGLDRIDANSAPCKAQGKASLPDCKDACPYFIALDEAEKGPLTVTNTSAFLSQANYSQRLEGPWDLIVVDEAHRIEEDLLRFTSWSISDRDLPFELPRVERAKELIDFLRAQDFPEICRARKREALAKGEAPKINYWGNMALRFKFLSEQVNVEPFILEWEKKRGRGKGLGRGRSGTGKKVDVKPLSVRRYARSLLFDRGRRFLLMSATILDPRMLAGLLGLPDSECGYIQVPSTFPVERRPIHVPTVGSMSYKNRNGTLPGLVRRIEEILTFHGEDRGIIHCQSFWLGDQIFQGVSSEARRRLIYQKELSKKAIKATGGDIRAAVLEELSQKTDGVILGPAFHEGVDLPDNLSRFQILAKIPYPDLNSSPQLSARVKTQAGAAALGGMSGWHYYQWLTALKLIQSYGRSVRSPEDWAHTYILDGDFWKFFAQAEGIIPTWFKEAIQTSKVGG